jgi:hypothetical protein
MTRKDLLDRLKELQNNKDAELAHKEADKYLILYIDDIEIKIEYNKITKWYV